MCSSSCLAIPKSSIHIFHLTMRSFILTLPASFLILSSLSALGLAHETQRYLGPDAATPNGHPKNRRPRFQCDLPRPIDPSADGMLSSHDVFSGQDALETMLGRHQPLVRIPSICYDDLGDFDEDERWEPFERIPRVLEETYPEVYKAAEVTIVNKFGLVYTFEGWDETLDPTLLIAHQDVVPVEEATLDQWEHPPFSAYYSKDDGFLWGRGASDDKSAITAVMAAMEELLSQDFEPRRTVIFAFGFDEECSGHRGAGEISKHLEKLYGEGGIAAIVDEGGLGLQSLDDTLYAVPGVYEKGYLDVWFELSVIGGHSSTPPPNTAIGIASEMVVALEARPFQPEVMKGSPMHEALICLARHSPRAVPELTIAINYGDLEEAARILSGLSRQSQYLIQTSQAIDVISGGIKINALPELVTVGVNHRYAPQDSIGSIQDRIVEVIDDIVRKYDLQLEAFEDDEDYAKYLAARGRSAPSSNASHLWEPVYNGTLVLRSGEKSYITPQTPSRGDIWDTFAGTVSHTFSREASAVVVAPGAMTANTDSRHYLNLSRNIYRWSPMSFASIGNIHTVNERLLMSEHLNMAKFYYDFIRNFDQADF
ncbi:hypothetical protein F4802DRAFT_566211 [Xylaria palmicola]|nr:hypothetical protein F4802DRAFT_566211 [Xylaria palmicola]